MAAIPATPKTTTSPKANAGGFESVGEIIARIVAGRADLQWELARGVGTKTAPAPCPPPNARDLESRR